MSNSTANTTAATTRLIAPEPAPVWSKARLQWGAAWELHWIGLGIAFALIAVHSLAALLMADKSKAFARRPLFFAVNFLLVIMGTVRAIFLWMDPYESTENGLQVNAWVNRVLFGIAFPCLTSAFCLIHVVFLEVSKIKLGSKKLHSIPFVSSIIVLHFIIVPVTDITVALDTDKVELLIVCQSFFIIWGFANSFAFLYSGGRVIHSSRRIRLRLSQISRQDSSNNGRARRGATTKVAKITMITAILGFACCALQIYSIAGLYGFYTTTIEHPEPWPWYAFQTGFRLVELAMGCTLAYTVIQPSQSDKTVLFKNCCKRMSKPESEIVEIGCVNITVTS